MPWGSTYNMNIDVRVIPNAKKRSITRNDAGITVKLTALPFEGKANRELIEYISAILKVKRSKVKIVGGEKSRHKTLSVPINPDELDALFKAPTEGPGAVEI